MNDGFQQQRTTPVTVRVRLHRGDARTVAAPVAVIGDRSPVRTWLEEQHGAVFERVITRLRFAPSPTPALTWQASPASGPWRHVMSVRTNVRRQRGTRLANDLSDTLGYAITQWAPAEILVLPLTWRDPDAVAMNTLMALWLVAYYTDFHFRGPWPDPQFLLASLDDSDRYREALGRNATNFYDWLAPIFERDAISFFGPKPVLDREKVIFDWTDDA